MLTIGRRLGLLSSVLCLCAAICGPASAELKIHTLVIGNNRVPRVGTRASEALRVLKYADDDAAAFFDFFAGAADSEQLLTIMDARSQRLYPHLVSVAVPPTKAALDAAVSALAGRIRDLHAAGHTSAVFVFFSGHGFVNQAGSASLALDDAELTRTTLYRDILEKLPADRLHLFVDACHAEAVVRPRDLEATVTAVTASEANAVLLHETLARFPRVGAILASTNQALAHEWDDIKHGIFTHELLSALRGAADVNRDRIIEYSEVFAFLSAANRDVSDERARLSVVARAPEANRRVALVELERLSGTRRVWLSDVSAVEAPVEIEDSAGRRLATLRTEPGYLADLLLPANRELRIRSGGQEASLSVPAGRRIPFASLEFQAVGVRIRGTEGEAVRRGLFASAYGPGYYRGFIDHAEDFIPVPLHAQTALDSPGPVAERERRPISPAPLHWVAAAGLSSSVASGLGPSHGLRFALLSGAATGPLAGIDVLRAVDGRVEEWRAAVRAGWMWSVGSGDVVGRLGATAGAGLVQQTLQASALDSGATARSGVASIGPSLALTTRFTKGMATWAELDAQVLIYRRDGNLVTSLAPAAWLGGYFGP
jgi:hypothetical protein